MNPHKTPDQIHRDLNDDSSEWSLLGFVLILSCTFVLFLGLLMR
jgi:hypothetical protein